MSFIFAPDHGFEKITDITPEFLVSNNIELLLMDLDNTISPYKINEPTDEVLSWADKCKEKGITLFIVSNNKSTERAGKFADALDIGFVHKSGKPSRRGVIYAMKKYDKRPENTALVGDQIFTDVLAANRSGITSLMVEPIKFTNVFLLIRYWLEKPFRALCNNKHRGE